MSTVPSPAGPAGRRRFWVTVFCFLIANTAAWMAYERFDAWRHHGQLRVELFEPGDNAVVGPKSTIRWRFNQDVIPTTVYGKDPGRVSPVVAGRWAWENPRTLSFVPAVDLPRATPVTFTLATDLLRSSTGARLDSAYVTSVHGTPLLVKSIQQSAMLDDDQFVVELKFNDRVAPGDVLQHVKAVLPDGTSLHLRAFGQATASTVRLATGAVPPVANQPETPLLISLTPGLTGTSGPLGLSVPFETTVTLGRSLMATEMSAAAPTRQQAFLTLNFNGAIDNATLKKILTIDPAVPFTIESYGGQSVMLRGNFQPGTRYTAHLAAAPKGTKTAELSAFPRAADLAAFVPAKGSDVWFDNDQGYLSTAGNRTLVAHAVNVKAVTVSVTRMYDNNLVAWRNTADSDRWYDTDPFSKPVARRTFPVSAKANVETDVRLSLDELIPAEVARAGVWRVQVDRKSDVPDVDSDADEEPAPRYGRYRYRAGSSEAVVTLSDIALTAKQTHDGVVVWAASLRTATPLGHVRVRAYSSKNQLLGESTTGPDGIARLSPLNPSREETLSVLIADTVTCATSQSTTQPTASASGELTWLDVRHTAWELGDSDTSGQPYLRTGHAAFMYTDRGVYRPGETLRLRAIVHGSGDVAPAKAFPVKWQLHRPDGRDWKSDVVMLADDGGASADVPLPTDLPSGQWSATLGLPGDKPAADFGRVTFLVEDFMPNRLKVAMTMSSGEDKSPKRYAISDVPLDVQVQGDYLFGRPASGLPVDLANHMFPTRFAPTGWEGWTFGDAAGVAATAKASSAVFHAKSRARKARDAPPLPDAARQAGDEQAPEANLLDARGHYRGSLDVADIVHFSTEQGSNQYMGPWRLSTDASVREAGGRAVTVSTQMDVDALPHYLAVRRNGGGDYARPGEPAEFQIKLVKPSGAPANDVDADLQAELFRDTWNTVLVYRGGRYHYDSTRVLAPVSSAYVHLTEGLGTWSVTPPDNGEYVLKITEPNTGAVTSQSFYVTSGAGWNDNVDRANPEHLDLRILRAGDSETTATMASGTTKATAPACRVGETARVLVASPFTGRLLLTVETDDVLQTQVVELTSSHAIIPITVTAACRPGAFITATVIRPIDPNAKWRTHRAFGVTRLNVDPSENRLHIAIDAPEMLRPFQSLDVGIKVTDPEGKPVVNATVTVAAVDEGICSLTNFKTPDPLAWFTSKRALGVRSADIYGLLMPELAKPEGASDTGGDKADADTGRHRSPVGARRVKPVAFAWAEVRTDAEGIARASFPLPEFQGRLRVMTVGYTAGLLGSADRGVTVRSPLLAQTSWPRFAAPGDRFTVPVVFFNNANTGGVIQATVELLPDPSTPAGLLDFDTAGQTCTLAPLTVAANGQQQINFSVTVAQAVGAAKVRLRATLNGESYSEETELPIRPPSPAMQFGGIASASPANPTTLTNFLPMMPGTGTVHVSLTPWPSLQLPRGLDYLDRYPYGCVEQTISTCFPLIALGDVGRQLDPVRFGPERIKVKIDAGINHLIGMQTSDGGLAMWTGQTESWPWATVYAAHFLTEAKAAGYEVPEEFYKQILSYVRRVQDEGTDAAQKLELQAYAAYVTTLTGKPDRAILDRLTELTSAGSRPDDPTEGASMRGDAQLFLSCAWLLAGRRDLAEGLLPDAVPTPRVTRQLEGNLGSPIRDRALLILAMQQVQPDRPELPGLVQQLADEGAQNHWASTQDVAFATLSLGRYLRDFHKKTPYESAQLKCRDKVLAEAATGNPLSWEAEASSVTSGFPLQLNLTGPAGSVGQLSWIQTGVPISPPAPESHGLKIQRRYLTLNDQPLKGTVRSGDLVRVEITIEAPPDQANLVIEDLLPAGFEVENPRLETAAKDPGETEDGETRPGKIPSFGNGRLDVQDDRVVIAGRMPSAWKARCTYLARAVTAGNYVVPPVRCEAMYDLNTNAVSSSGRLTVLGTGPNIAAAE